MTNKGILYCLLLFILHSGYGLAQINNDSIFARAIHDSRQKNYDSAIESAKGILKSEPQRYDIMVFIANNYAWQHQLDTAKTYIIKAHEINAESSELYDSWLNILLWNKEYDTLLSTCELALANGYNNGYNLLLKKALANNALENYTSVTDLITQEENKPFFDSVQIQSIYNNALILSKPKQTSFYYAVDLFNDKISHYAFIDYGFNISNDRLIFRLNYANRFDTNGIQIEADYYKILGNKRYVYLNYGYAIDNILFPQHRAGAEYYFPIATYTNASLGARYLSFTNSNVTIATGHVSQYLGKYWLALRPFYVMQKAGNSFSLVNTYRKYLSTDYNYWGLELGYGNTPEERASITQSNNYLSLTSYKIKIERNLLVGKTNELKVGISFANEEVRNNDYKGRYTLELMYKLRSK